MLEIIELEPAVLNNPLLKGPLLALRILGHIVSNDDKLKGFHYLRGLIIAVTHILAMVAQAGSAWINRHNFNKMASTLLSLFMFSMFVGRKIMFYLNSRRNKKLIADAHRGIENILKSNIPNEMIIYTSYVNRTRRFGLVFANFMIWGSVYIGINLLNFFIFSYPEIKQSPNTTVIMPRVYDLYPLDFYSEKFVIPGLPFFLSWLASFEFWSWIMINVTMMRYASLRLDIINSKLENINGYIGRKLARDGSSLPQWADDRRKAIFVSCVEEIVDIRQFVARFMEATRASLFADSLIATVALCLLMYQISRNAMVEALYFLALAVSIAGMLCVYYWHANNISEQSDKICTSLYYSPWYKFDLSLQKDILIFMKAFRNPIKMKAGLFDINMNTYVLMIKTSYSFFVVVKNFGQ